MTPSLDGPYSKLRRAGDHLYELERLLQMYRSAEPYRWVKDLDEEKALYVYRLEIRVQPFVDIGIVFGEIVHQLRSALDHLAWQLVLANEREPTRNTGFPMFKTESPEKFSEMTEGICAEAVELIDSFQPYHDGNAAQFHHFAMLSKLDIIDKHRTVIPGAMLADVPFLLPDCDFRQGPLNDGDEFARIPADLKPEESFEPYLSFEEAFPIGRTGRRLKMDGLRQIHHFMGQTMLPRFAKFFTCA